MKFLRVLALTKFLQPVLLPLLKVLLFSSSVLKYCIIILWESVSKLHFSDTAFPSTSWVKGLSLCLPEKPWTQFH